jgi:hypothetical protein
MLPLCPPRPMKLTPGANEADKVILIGEAIVADDTDEANLANKADSTDGADTAEAN